MRIGIVCPGLMGGKFGKIFARAGHQVVFSYARSEQKLKRVAAELIRNVGFDPVDAGSLRIARYSAGRQALGWSHCNYGYGAHRHSGGARWQSGRLDGKGDQRTISGLIKGKKGEKL